MLQLFAYETFGLKRTNIHFPEFLTLRLNHELEENQVHRKRTRYRVFKFMD